MENVSHSAMLTQKYVHYLNVFEKQMSESKGVQKGLFLEHICGAG